MATTLNAITSSTGLVVTPDSSGILQLQTANTTAVTIDASQNVAFAKGFTVGATAAPAFSAYPSSNQSVTTSTFTKILFQTTEFDTTSGMYSSSRFMPTVAGYYQVELGVSPNSATTQVQACIYKNGGLQKRGFTTAISTAAYVTALVYLNGSTDYIEGWGYLVGTTPIVQGSSDQTYFQAAMIRSA